MHERYDKIITMMTQMMMQNAVHRLHLRVSDSGKTHDCVVAWHSGRTLIGLWPANFPFSALDLQLMGDHLCG